jgi:hypothetical protein
LEVGGEFVGIFVMVDCIELMEKGDLILMVILLVKD